MTIRWMLSITRRPGVSTRVFSSHVGVPYTEYCLKCDRLAYAMYFAPARQGGTGLLQAFDEVVSRARSV